MIRHIKKLIQGQKKPVQSFPRFKNITIDPTFQIGEYKNISIENGAKICIHPHVVMRNFCNVLVQKNGNLKIGENTFFNNYCSVNCLDEIEIGHDTLFGEGVKIYDHNHIYGLEDRALLVERNKFKTSSVKIGNNCWIGSNVTILKGVEIGNNAIIGANNLIYKNIPANSITKNTGTYVTEEW